MYETTLGSCSSRSSNELFMALTSPSSLILLMMTITMNVEMKIERKNILILIDVIIKMIKLNQTLSRLLYSIFFCLETLLLMIPSVSGASMTFDEETFESL
jgi:hypothetical protein